jgi:hypothetical protein
MKRIYLFTSPGCIYCRALAPTWASFTALVKEKYADEVEILVWTKGEPTPTWAKGLSDKELLDKFHVEGYPHIVAEMSSETSHLSRPYTQERSVKALEAWLLSNFGLGSEDSKNDGHHEQRDGGDQDYRKPRMAGPSASSHSLALSLFSTKPHPFNRGGA